MLATLRNSSGRFFTYDIRTQSVQPYTFIGGQNVAAMAFVPSKKSLVLSRALPKPHIVSCELEGTNKCHVLVKYYPAVHQILVDDDAGLMFFRKSKPAGGTTYFIRMTTSGKKRKILKLLRHVVGEQFTIMPTRRRIYVLVSMNLVAVLNYDGKRVGKVRLPLNTKTITSNPDGTALHISRGTFLSKILLDNNLSFSVVQLELVPAILVCTGDMLFARSPYYNGIFEIDLSTREVQRVTVPVQGLVLMCFIH